MTNRTVRVVVRVCVEGVSQVWRGWRDSMVRRSVHCLVQAMVHGQCTATHLHRSIKLKKHTRHGDLCLPAPAATDGTMRLVQNVTNTQQHDLKVLQKSRGCMTSRLLQFSVVPIALTQMCAMQTNHRPHFLTRHTLKSSLKQHHAP